MRLPLRVLTLLAAAPVACGDDDAGGAIDGATATDDGGSGGDATPPDGPAPDAAPEVVSIVCEPGVDHPLVTGLTGRIDLLRHGDWLFWAADGRTGETTSVPGHIGRLSLDTGIVTRLVDDLVAPRALVADDEHLYFASGAAADEGGGIFRIPLAGGPVEPFAEMRAYPWPILLDGDVVYWQEQDEEDTHLVMAPKGRGPAEELADGTEAVYDLAAGERALFLAELNPQRVSRVPKAGGAIEPLDFPSYGATGILLSGRTVYFLSFDGRLWRVPANGAEDAEPLTPPTLTNATNLVVDGDVAYWVNGGGLPVARAPLTGGEVEMLDVTGPARDVALAGSCLFWSRTGLTATSVHSTAR